MIAFVCIALCLAMAATLFRFWERCGEIKRARVPTPFMPWLVQGAVVPFLVMVCFNSGWIPGVSALTGSPWIAGPNGYLGLYEYVVNQSFLAFLIFSWWSVISLGWLLGAQARDEWNNAIHHAQGWALIGLIPALAVMATGWSGLGFGTAILLAFGFYGFLLGLPRLRVQPQYSRVIGAMKLGKPEDAEVETIRELERFEDDFEGWMLLAEVYAKHYHDINLAEKTVYELCAQKNLTISDMSVALHRLADWQLEIGEDPRAARFALEEICRRLPGTHLATMARHRINRLPGNREELLASRVTPTIKLKPTEEGN